MTNQAASVPAGEIVRGVNLSLVNLTVLNSALKDAGIAVTAKTKVDERVSLLADFDAKEIGADPKKGGACDKCGGVSLLSRPSCPFCGTGEEQPMADSPAAAPKPRSKKEATAKAKPADAAPPATKPTRAQKAAAKQAPAEPAAAEPPVEVIDPPKPTLAKTSGSGKVTAANVKELDAITKRIKSLIGDSMVSYWKLGQELTNALKTGVYKFRLDSAKVPVHANFAAYCANELNLTVQHARNLMAVSEAFTEDQVREIGITKLKILVRVPEGLRDELLAKAAGLPTRALEAAAQEVAPGATREALDRDDGKARPHLRDVNATQNRPRPTRAVAPNEATAVIVPERFELPMWARAKSSETGMAVRATSVAADPTGVFDMQNGMHLVLKITEDDSGLVIVGEFKRAE